MKIRHPLAIKSAAFGLSVWLRAWMSTCPLREEYALPESHPTGKTGRYLYLFWHETLVSVAGCYAKLGIPVLVSQHRDGELITQVIRFLGGDAIRGSSTRGGDRALRDMLERSQGTHLAVTPDGPKGPRRTMQLGPVYLASRARIQIVPLGVAASRAWRANSWDKLAIPKPFRPVQIVGGLPIDIPVDVQRSDMEQYRLICEQRLNEAQDRAESLAG